MNLVIFAASGGIGRELLKQALAAGHHVTAVVRDPAKLGAPTNGTRVIRADLATPDPRTLERAVAGADAVLSGLGPHSNAEAGIAERGTRAIVEAMEATGVERLVVVSAAPVGAVPSPGNPHPPTHDPGDGFFMRHVIARIARRALGRVFSDLARMEDALRASGLRWTSFRPPRLTDGRLTGRYRTALGRNLVGGVVVSRADVAHAMLGAIDLPQTFHRTVGIARRLAWAPANEERSCPPGRGAPQHTAAIFPA